MNLTHGRLRVFKEETTSHPNFWERTSVVSPPFQQSRMSAFYGLSLLLDVQQHGSSYPALKIGSIVPTSKMRAFY